ncbi:MAG: PASTA domain-containing protein, partial [Gaiellales bacterium]
MSSVPPPRDPRDPLGDPIVVPPLDEQRQVEEESRFRQYLPWVLIAILGVVIIAGLGIWYFTKGSDKKPVPAVVGLRIDNAVARLQADGFKLQTQRAASARAPGIVFGQNPAQGTDEPKGSTVKLLVSRGPSRATVPNAVGESQTQARSALVAAGFEVTSSEVFSDQPTGTVVAQAPAAGGHVTPGSKVHLNISKGSATVGVPSEVGQTLAQAQSELASKGFKTTITRVPSDQPIDTV